MITIREETAADAEAISAVTEAAFATAPHASGTEAAIVERLRAAGALVLSLVAEEDGAVVGHVAFSPVDIADGATGFHALGPVSVRPDRQRRGIGSALVREGLARMRAAGARGVTLVGDPVYYERFGFRQADGLVVHGVPPVYVLALPFDGEVPTGALTHHPAFGLDGAS